MENKKLSYAQLLKLSKEQQNEIELLRVGLAKSDTSHAATPENQNNAQATNGDRLLLAAKVAGLGYFEWFPKKNTIVWDPVMHEIFGLQADSTLDKNNYFYEVLHPEDKERVITDTIESLSPKCKQSNFPIEYRIVLPNKQIKYIQAYSLHFRNKDGEVIRIIGTCQDISQRVLQEKKVRETELRYFQLVNTISSGVAVYKVINQGAFGDDYIIQDFNTAALNIEGLQKEEVIGKSIKDLRPKIDEYGLIPIFRKVWETGEPANYPAKGYKDDKYYNYYQNRVYRLPNMEIVAVYDDVTEREEAARALAENRKLLLTIAENYPNSFVSIINKDFTIGFSSGQEFKNQNLNPESFVGLPINKIFGEHTPLVKTYYQKTFEGNEQNFELYINNQHQLYKTVPLPDQDGNINKIMAVVENISEKRHIEIALKENEKKYRLLAENAVEIIWQMDLKLKFTYVNPATYKTFGYTPNEWIGTKLSAYATRKEFFKMARQAITIIKNYRLKNHMSFETKMLSKDGIEIPVEITGRIVFNEAGLPIAVQGVTRDISERKKSEEALRKSEEQFRLMFENHNAVMLLINPANGQIVRANKSAEKFYGYATNEITNKTIDDINILPANEVSVYRRQAVEGKANSFQFRHILKDGRIKDVAVHSTIIVFEGIEVLFSIIHDVTEKVLAEEALRQSEEKYRLIADHASDVIWIMDLNSSRFLYISPSIYQLRGMTQQEAMLESLNDSLSPESREKLHKIIPKRLKDYFHNTTGNEFYIDELQQYKKDGSLFWVETSTRFQQNSKGEIQVFGISRNIDERKRAEEKIRISEEKYRLLLNNQTDLIVKVDHKGRFLFVSPNYCKIFGKTESQLLGSQFLPMVHEDDKAHTKTEMEKLYSPPHTCTIQQRALTRQGWRWFEWLDSAILDDNGKVKEIIGVGRDITERKKDEKRMLEINEELAVQNEEYEVLNEELNANMEQIRKINDQLEKAKDQAQESDRLKSAFLANMSHEIRTPMNGILGFSDLLKTPNLTGSEQQKYINIIEKSGQRMLGIINDLIDISKIEAGQMELVISDSNISEQLDYLFTFFKPEAEQKGLSLSCINPLKGNEALIRTDREKVYAVLTNLIKNAVKYTRSGGIEFGYTLVQVNKKPFLQFYVTDSGIGIPYNRQEAIFERFIQADIEDKQVFEGAGLGLAISKAYVKLLGGDIWVDSQINAGSSFYFTIPYILQKPKEIQETFADSESLQSLQRKNLKVLIAEDDETSKYHLSLVMSKIAKEVLLATSGTQAVEMCKKHPDLDLILMDIKMPGMNGYEATREIRKFNSAVVIIAQTAYALTGDRDKAIEAGCNEYIAKPVKMKTLNALIHRFF